MKTSLRSLCATLCQLGTTLREADEHLTDILLSAGEADLTDAEAAHNSAVADVLCQIDQIRDHLNKERP